MKKIIYFFIVLLFCSYSLKAQEKDVIETNGNHRDAEVVVGAIGGSVDVSGLGGATYSIPVNLPEGIGGVQPALSIVYNSQSGNGLLGWGWNLGGLSAITRTGTTMYHDNCLHGVAFSTNFNNRDDLDRFALDGQRLMVVNGLPDGGDGTEYRTEIDQMAKIVSYSCDTTYGPAYFKVWLSNGNIAYYGSRWDSRIGLQQHNDVCVWLLDSVVDRNGNYMSYKYCRGYANYFLTDIYYTGNNRSGVSPLYRIKLEYDTRPDEETVFIGNNALHQSMILKRVSVHNTTNTKNRLLWQYDFNYLGGNGTELYKKLETITFSGGGEEYKATTIRWGTDNNQFSSVQFSFTGDGQMRGQCVKFPGDFNGDGYTDMITVEKNTDGSGKTARVYLNGRDASGNVVFTQIEKYPLDENITWIYIADFDGDGLDDFMFANRERRDFWLLRDIVTLDIYITRRNGNGGLDFVRHETPHADYRLASSKRDVLILGDFLGEGKTSFILEISQSDEIGMETETNATENDTIEVRRDRSLYFFYDKTLQQFVEHRVEINGVIGADVYYPADYDGDGKTEILYSYPQNGYTSTAIVKLFYSNGQYGFVEHYNGRPTNWKYCYPGDFNGDGHADALFRFNDYDPDGEWRVFLFKQNRFLWNSYFCWDIGQDTNPVIKDNPVNLENMFGNSEYLRVGDFNGDGKADIMYPNNYGRTIICFGPMRNDSGYPPYSYRKVINTYPYFSTANVCYGNFLGKECIQYLGYIGSNGYNNLIRCVHPISNRYNVSTIEDGMTNRVRFEYDYLMPTLSGDHTDDFFSLNDNQTHAGRYIFSRAMPIKALKKAITDNFYAGTPLVETHYRYSNVMIHTRGHGVLGFTDIISESYVADRFKGRTKQHFSTSELGDKCQSVLKETFVYGPDNNLSQRSEYKYSVCQSQRNDKLFIPLSISQTGWHYSLDGSHGFEKQTLNLNNYLSDMNSSTVYNNIIHCIKSYQCINNSLITGSAANLPMNYTYRKAVENEYDDLLSSWIVNRAKSMLSVVEGNATEDNEDVKSLTIYEYNHVLHPTLPSRIDNYPSGVHPDSPIYVRDRLATRETFTYNTNGTINERTFGEVYATTLPVVNTTYGYNYGGQFLENVTNTKGYVTQYQYDTHGYGWLIGETDCNNLQTIYSRSPLGSLQSVVHPDQTQSRTERIWVAIGDAHAPRNAEYKEVSTQMDTNGQTITTASTYYDAAGRCLRAVTFGIEGEAIYSDTRYNSQGLIDRVSAPYFYSTAEQDIKWTSYQYDYYDRIILTKFADDTYQTIDYDGFVVKTTMHPSSGEVSPQTVTKTVNAAGWLTESTDAAQNTVKYTYYADGCLKHAQIGNDANTRVSMEYDNARNRTKLTDPDYGTVVSSYDAYGQMESSINPRSVSTRYQYDELGRVYQRTEQPRGGEPVTTVWNYCDEGNEKGLLRSIDYHNGEQTLIYKYDNLKRVASVSEVFGGRSLTTIYQYEPNTGRLHETTYPTGYKLRREYSPTGHLRRLADAEGATLWLTREKNAMGQITKYMTGNYVGSTLTYDDDKHCLRGIVTQQVAKNRIILQDMLYDYDDFGNLAARTDNLRDLEERFTYDNLNRLESISLNGGVHDHIKYDHYGRIQSKQSDGNMLFDQAEYDDVDKPHAIRGAQMYGSPFPTDHQNITYTLFDKVATITQSGNGPQMSLSYTYGYDRQRIHMEEKLGNYTLREKRYGDHCEIVTENRYTVSRTFLTGPLGVFAVVEHNGEDDEIHYVYKDHLGSWTTITNASGVVEREQSFDAWGNMRDPETWSGDYDNTLMFDRGFTGHEHLYGFGLINMNGRVYDPVMSTFLSPDNYIQAPDFSQSFNRYAYCLNNPLKYTDPSGESIVLAVLVGAFWSSAMSLAVNFDNISTDADFVNTVTLGALGGALGGVAGFGVSSAVAGWLGTTGAIPGFLTTASGGFAGGFAGTTVTSWCTGATFGDGLWAGLKAGAISGLTAGLIGAHNGAIDAINAGGEMWWGDGASFDQISAVTISGEPVNYDQTTAEQFSKESFGDDISGLRNLYADGRVPPENNRFIWVKKPDGSVHVYEKIDGQLKWLGRTNGTTRYISNRFIRKSDVYLYETAFCSKEQLYLTMGHEYIHCGFNIDKSLGNPTLDQTRNIQEASCYQWEINQARAWGYEKYATHMEGIYNEIYKGYLNPRYQPSISIISIRPWLK